MAKKRGPLSPEEILEFEETFREVFGYLSNLKSRRPIAGYIQFPKIPPIISESLVFHMSPQLFGEVKSRAPGGSKGDLIIIDKSGRTIRVEVKATGGKRFQFLYHKDISADYLVWVHFGNYFEHKKNGIEIHTLMKPDRVFKGPAKITLPKFLERTAGFGLKTARIERLEELVRLSKKHNDQGRLSSFL